MLPISTPLTTVITAKSGNHPGAKVDGNRSSCPSRWWWYNFLPLVFPSQLQPVLILPCLVFMPSWPPSYPGPQRPPWEEAAHFKRTRPILKTTVSRLDVSPWGPITPTRYQEERKQKESRVSQHGIQSKRVTREVLSRPPQPCCQEWSRPSPFSVPWILRGRWLHPPGTGTGDVESHRL